MSLVVGTMAGPASSTTVGPTAGLVAGSRVDPTVDLTATPVVGHTFGLVIAPTVGRVPCSTAGTVASPVASLPVGLTTGITWRGDATLK